MNDPAAFMLAVLALLATPGPTNTLLLTAGAAGGGRGVWRLLLAEVTAYLLAVVTLAVLLGPVIRGSAMLDTGLRLVCSAYLAYVAATLWCRGAAATAAAVGPAAVTPRQVFVTTLLNPKGSIFAFIIVPYAAEGDLVAALPYLAGLALAIVTVALGWFGLGVMVHRRIGRGAGPAVVCRCGAAALAVLAVMLAATVFRA